MKFRRNEAGEMEEVREERQGISVREAMEQLALDPVEHLTAEQRRARVAAYKELVEAPAELGFHSYLRSGKDFLTEEQRTQTTVTSGGGYLIPASFAQAFTISLKRYDQLFDISTLVETDRGSACTFPLEDDSSVAAIVAENGESNYTASVFDQVSFSKCPQWRSGHVIAPMELAADSAFDLAALLASAFGRRMARGVGAAFITQLLSDAATGVTTAASSPTADEILDLIASLDNAYGVSGSFLMSASTLTTLQKLKTSTGGAYALPIFQLPDGQWTLFFRPVFISPSMPAIGAGAKCIAFGDLSRFIRRQVRNSMEVKIYRERYAEKAQVAYEMFLRTQGQLAKATHMPVPVQLLVCKT